MTIVEIVLLSIIVSLDTFPVAICKGMNKKNPFLVFLVCSVWFCSFQILMLTIGFFISNSFSDFVDAFDHWIAFAIFLLLGINMIKESFEKSSKKESYDLKFKNMFFTSFATSIDSLIIGIGASLFELNILIFCTLIAFFTAIFTFFGIFIGYKFGKRYKKITGICGGILLILIGLKILIEHLFF